MINIFISANRKILDMIALQFLSIKKYVNEPVNYYIGTMDLQDLDKSYIPITDEDISFLETLLPEGSNVKLIDFSSVYRNVYKSADVLKYTPYSLCRLMINYIPEFSKLEKILYLDCDIMAAKDIRPLWDIDIANYEMAAVIDIIAKRYFKTKYVNSGVLLMNLNMLRETKLLEETIKLTKRKKYFLLDQTALNRCKHKILYIDEKYNKQWGFNSKTVLKHFCNKIEIFPLRVVNIKQNDFEKVNKILKITYFNDIFEEYEKISKNYHYLTEIKKKKKKLI